MGRRELDYLFRVRDRRGAVVDVAMSSRNTGILHFVDRASCNDSW